jgi:hypothetical protein
VHTTRNTESLINRIKTLSTCINLPPRVPPTLIHSFVRPEPLVGEHRRKPRVNLHRLLRLHTRSIQASATFLLNIKNARALKSNWLDYAETKHTFGNLANRGSSWAFAKRESSITPPIPLPPCGALLFFSSRFVLFFTLASGFPILNLYRIDGVLFWCVFR